MSYYQSIFGTPLDKNRILMNAVEKHANPDTIRHIMGESTYEQREYQNENGETPLQHAIHLNQMVTVHILVRGGVDLCTTDNDMSTPLITAAYCDVDVHRILIGLYDTFLIRKSINSQDVAGRTALHHAVIRGNLNNIQQLLDQDANIYIPDNENYTPYRLAQSSNVNILSMFREAAGSHQRGYDESLDTVMYE
jgi:ankyrin repeat protein